MFLWNMSPSLAQTTFQKVYGGVADDFGGYAVEQTSDGGYIIAGHSFFGDDGQAYLIKTNSRGHTLWTRTYGGTEDELAWSVQQTSDDGYIVTGYTWSFGAGNYDRYLIKTNSLGDTLWTRTYGGADFDECYSVRQTSDNGYILTSYTYSFGSSGADVYLIKTDHHGDFSIITTVAVLNQWNLLSGPVTASDYRKTTLFPAAVSNAFAYAGSYGIKDTLRNGVGYWLKFDADQNLSVSGGAITDDSIEVQQG
jgi:hypothetical protein